jgi:hypothetical protein
MCSQHVCGQYAVIIKLHVMSPISGVKAKVWKIPIPGRPNQGMPRNRGWAANPNTSGRSRDRPHLCPASPFTSPSTQVSVRLFNELKYSETLEILHNTLALRERPYFTRNGLHGKTVHCVGKCDIAWKRYTVLHLISYTWGAPHM